MAGVWSAEKQDTLLGDDEIRYTDTVILGAGVIGLSTAYHLALAFHAANQAKSSPSTHPRIVVIEPSQHVSPGASGQATGGLGDFGFGPETSALGVLSYNILKELAAKFDNGKDFGFSDLSVYRLTPQNFTGTPNPPNDWGPMPPVDKPLSDLPPWIKTSEEWNVQLLAKSPHAAHLFSSDNARGSGSGSCSTQMLLPFKHTIASSASRALKYKEQGSEHLIRARSVVVSAGPWTGRVFSALFPDAKIALPLNATTAAENHFRVRTPHWKPSDDTTGSVQIFIGSVIPSGKSLDITSFVDGTLYVAGYGAIPQELPDFADEVKPQPTEIEAMVELAKTYLNIESDVELEVLDAGRCYRPLATPNHPIITKIDWDQLGINRSQTPSFQLQYPACSSAEAEQSCRFTEGGLYLNTAHYSDGVTLSLGSGKVMSEILLGVPPSVNVSGLGFEDARSNCSEDHARL